MYVVFIIEEALEDLTTIVGHISAENVAAAETLGNESLDEAMSLELMPYRGSVVKKEPALRKLMHGNYLVYYRIKEPDSSLDPEEGAAVQKEGKFRVSLYKRRRHETEFKARWVPLLKKTFNVGDRSLPQRHALFPRRIDAWRA